MKRISRGAALLLAMTLVSSSFCLAAGPAAQTVRGTIWNEWHITVNETPICTINEYGQFQYLLFYNDTIYIPLQTASEWLGATFFWNESAATLTLTKSVEPYYRHRTLEHPASILTEEDRIKELAQYDVDISNGVEIVLRPDITVYLDGKLQLFTNARGETITPMEFRGVRFLPVRSAAQMCGKEITYLPRQYDESGVEGTSVSDFSLLYKPVLTQGLAPNIFLYDKPTQAQLDGVQAFLDEAEQLLFDGPLPEIENFLACDRLSDEDCIAWLRKINSYADHFAQLPKPDVTFMTEEYRGIINDAKDLSTDLAIFYIEEGLLDFGRIKAAGSFPDMLRMTQSLHKIRFKIAAGQRKLDAVRTQTQL